jgi:CBS domain containing-hemolysin-like protein
MIATICGILLIVLGLAALALQRFYSSIPAKELKRLAARGDQLAAALYRPVAHGESLRLLLWLLVGAGLSGGFLLVVSALDGLLAFGIVALSLVGVVLLQSMRLTVRSAHLAVKASPALAWLLNYLHAPLNAVAGFVNRYRSREPHSELYEKEDIIHLLQQQKEQPDNRITEHDLNLLVRAAQFDDRQAADIALPMARLKPVSVEDHIGPVLLGELHNSGQSSFLVYEDTPDHVVGTLFLRDAVAAKEGGQVRALMHSRLCFVHEDFSLRQVLQAFTRTGQFMVVVINSFAEPVGVITLGHLLAQLVGETAADDFDAFEDRAAVANWQPQPVAVPVEDEGPVPDESADAGEQLPTSESID